MSQSTDIQLTNIQLIQIQQFAEGLSPSEVASSLGIELEELSPEAYKLFMQNWQKGRNQIKLYAVEKLKSAMDGKQGFQAALAVLTRFAEDWPEGDDKDGTVPKSFKIVLD